MNKSSNLPRVFKVTCLAFSPNNKLLISGSHESITFWYINNDQLNGQTIKCDSLILDRNDHQVVIGQYDWVNSVAISPNGKVLAIAFSSGWRLSLWNIDTLQLSERIQKNTVVNTLAFSPDGNLLAAGGGDLSFWDTKTRQLIGEPMKGHKKEIVSISFNPDGKIIASGSKDCTLCLWDVASRQLIGQPLTGHKDEITSIAFNLNGKNLVSGSLDGTILMWDILTQKTIGKPFVGHEKAVTCIAFNPVNNILASGSKDNTILLWSIDTQQTIEYYHAMGWVNCINFSSDGNYFASGNEAGAVGLWRRCSDTNQPYYLMKSYTGNVYLTARELNLNDAQQLSTNNSRLLTQLGAIGQTLAQHAKKINLKRAENKLPDKPISATYPKSSSSSPGLFKPAAELNKDKKQKKDSHLGNDNDDKDNPTKNEKCLIG